MKYLRYAAAALVLIALAGSAATAADDAVARFRVLEESLGNAIMAQDTATLDGMLADDFTLTVAVTGHLLEVDRSTWLENAGTTYIIHAFAFHQIIVREHGDTAVVSSRYTQQATASGRDLSAEFFLTDVWVRSDGGWEIAARYSSRPEAG